MAKTNTDANEEVKMESAGFSAYIGPSLPGIIQNGTIIPGSVEEAKQNEEILIAVKAAPGIEDLIVDGNILSESMVKVKTKGEDLYKKYISLIRKK